MAAEQIPGVGSRAAQQAKNFGTGLKHSQVKRVLTNGLHLAFVNTVGAFTTEFLNFYLESRGLNQRRMTLMTTPNPYKDVPQNPLSRKVG